MWTDLKKKKKTKKRKQGKALLNATNSGWELGDIVVGLGRAREEHAHFSISPQTETWLNLGELE